MDDKEQTKWHIILGKNFVVAKQIWYRNTNPCIFLENMSELGYKLIGITSIDNYVFEKVKK
jgi:hypothetical protein